MRKKFPKSMRETLTKIVPLKIPESQGGGYILADPKDIKPTTTLGVN